MRKNRRRVFHGPLTTPLTIKLDKATAKELKERYGRNISKFIRKLIWKALRERETALVLNEYFTYEKKRDIFQHWWVLKDGTKKLAGEINCKKEPKLFLLFIDYIFQHGLSAFLEREREVIKGRVLSINEIIKRDEKKRKKKVT